MIAGGPGTSAGGVIQILHDDSAGACDTGDPQHRIMSLETPDVTLLKLEDVMHANPVSNPFVRPGDFINLPEANQAYVVGNVFKPSSIALNGTITISRAIAMAGGALPNSKGRIRLLRLMPDNTGNREIFLNLKALQRNTNEDLALMAGDIVEVPLSETKLILKSIFTTVAAGAMLDYPLIVIR
jgi:protein involved in polysaccharide export with SLBB domain